MAAAPARRTGEWPGRPAPVAKNVRVSDALACICAVTHTVPVTEVVALDEFADWYSQLSDDEAEAVGRYVGLLEQFGIKLRAPYSSAIKGSEIALRELRVRHAGASIRVLYVFDPERQAVLILGGDKKGDDRFYERAIPKAEELYREYVKTR
jgi:hypothetical protein